MTTLAVTAANIAANTAAQAATAFALSTANRAISHIFDNRVFEGPRLESLHVQTSRDGAPMSRVYGRVRLAGQVIWASRLREIRTEEEVQSGKGGGPTRTTYSYTMSFAVGLCEGEILGVDRLWANGEPLASAGVTMRVYKGTSDQMPDPIISAIEGGPVPAFRDTAYIVFEDFPLDGFGARLPQINAEVIRVPPSQGNQQKMENLVKSVSLLPGSGEFAYATQIIEETPELGVSRPINMNNLSGQADILLALDQLEDQLPNCSHVSIITSWFGTDLRCGECEIRPGVERRDRIIPNGQWQVGTDPRGQAYLVSSDAEGRPNFGGTPSDESILQAIQALKQRGFKVTLYPFILMDIPDGPSPFPWRGRIASENGTDGHAGIAAQVAQFFEGPNGFRNFVLHYADLAQQAGGVDGFVLGSEMRGLTTLRGERAGGKSTYPAVTHLVSLASEVRARIGSDAMLTYAADWSEYFGHHPQDGSGDVSFHLDPLWASPDISAVGIDAYFRLSDWREGAHLDQNLARDIYDLAYLQSQIEGGEGYDYFYGSDADRDAQIRSSITDGGAGKPWVFRYKDIRNWWSQPHFDRVGGVEVAQPTAWQPQSKPIIFTEIGCPAVHFGANQPNVFYDTKSSESRLPHYSNGERDDLIQRRYLEAFISYWDDPAHNPISPVYSGQMINTDRMSVWTWDARPFPDFPARDNVWSDGENWQKGHWIAGRVGLVTLADIVRDISAQSGLLDINTQGLNGLVQGYHIDRPMSARAAISTLSELYGFSLAERAGTVAFFSLGEGEVRTLTPYDLMDHIDGPVTRSYADPAESLRDVRLHFIDAGTEYQLGLASARDRLSETERILDINAPVVMDRSFANYLCDNLMERIESQSESVRFSLSPQNLTLEAGDRVRLPNIGGVWRVEALEGQVVQAKRDVASPVSALQGMTPDAHDPIIYPGRPVPISLNLPAPFVGLAVGALLSPFSDTVIEATGESAELRAPLRLGALLTDIPSGPSAYFDRAAEFEILMAGTGLNSKSEDAVLLGANRFAVETPQGWDFLQAANMTLIGPNRYRCDTILRGVGSEGYSRQGVTSGARIVWLDAGVQVLDINPDYIGEAVSLTAIANERQSAPTEFEYAASHLKPLSPAHLTAKRDAGALVINWIRRSRVDADSWLGEVPLGEGSERYRVRLWDGETLIETAEVTTPSYQSMAPNLTHIDVSQGSDLVGWGATAKLLISAS
ncbi:baseplate multidomain protein megatron [Litorimonas haliclonae]|uniref:baseplate multidomain protein megatron n=1 Tax=Litorimonas haliclonae TaxID=2081977 RepID=UPI0039EF8154